MQNREYLKEIRKIRREIENLEQKLKEFEIKQNEPIEIKTQIEIDILKKRSHIRTLYYRFHDPFFPFSDTD